MVKTLVIATPIKKVNTDGVIYTDDLLATEEPLEIRLGFGEQRARQQQNISVTMRTPGHDFELAIGFLFTEGIIKSVNDIYQIKYCKHHNREEEDSQNIVRVELHPHVEFEVNKLTRNFYTTSSCGVCGKASIESIKTTCNIVSSNDTITIDADLIYQLPNELRKHQNVFEYTGGLHAAALFDTNGNLIFVREDVGRHNALDKLIGAALPHHLITPSSHHLLLLSGRASFELVQKAAMAGIKVIAAVGAPSSLAVQMAKEFDSTLIGFLREKRFNIYSGEKRVNVTK